MVRIYPPPDDSADEIAREMFPLGNVRDVRLRDRVAAALRAYGRAQRNAGLEDIMRRWPGLRLVVSSDVPKWAHDHGSNVVLVISGPFAEFGDEPSEELAALLRNAALKSTPESKP